MIPRSSLFYKLSCLGLLSKVIRILQATYENNESRIWDGNTFSKPFPVNVGVKQGCIMSPLLFSLYVNDLADILPHGVFVAGTNIKILLYADDIVILADSQPNLQEMIDSLYSYCSTWCLQANLAKSKIVVFRAGARISSNLRWKWGSDNIEIVNNYKYLGVDITYNLSFTKHLNNKLAAAKLAINSTWSKYLNNPKISTSNKLKIFHAASRSILFYAAQVWGYQRFDLVEKLFRFFIKKMFYLPSSTPNYMLYLETGYHSLYVSTLKLHFSYINKVLNMSRSRLPRILTETILAKNVFWALEWSNIQLELQYTPTYPNTPLCKNWKTVLNRLIAKEREDNLHKASNSLHHDLYSFLYHNTTEHSVVQLPSRIASRIIKARGGLLNLNARAYSNSSTSICTICNRGMVEDTYHFLGACPIYNIYRRQYFGKTQLRMNDVIDILNGSNYYNLYKYLEICSKYRNLIVNEFGL